MKPLYTGIATASGGREGRVRSSDDTFDLKLAMPKTLGGAGDTAAAGTGGAENRANPEQLFAAGYAACFESALRLVAVMQMRPLTEASVTAHVTLGQDGDIFDLQVELHAKLPEVSRDEAQALMEAAHKVCPYSRATRGNIDVKLVVD